MVKRIGSKRRKTRSKLTKPLRTKGKISFSRYFQTLKEGDKVALIAEPAIQKGVYAFNFFGKIGTIKGKQGRCYQVHIMDRTKSKMLIVHPVHLKKL